MGWLGASYALPFPLAYLELPLPDPINFLTPGLTHQAPATIVAFYFFNHAQAAPNGFQYLAPSSASAANSELFSRPNKFQLFLLAAKPALPTFELY